MKRLFSVSLTRTNGTQKNFPLMTTCKYWVKHKRRFCKFQVPAASQDGFCAVHSHGTDDNERIPCPVDPRHTIYKADTEKHVKKCSLVVDEGFAKNQPFTVLNCNIVSESVAVDTIPGAISVEDIINPETLSKHCGILLDRIRALVPGFMFSESFECNIEPISTDAHPTTDEITKHDLQNAAILKEMCWVGLGPSHNKPRLYVELGCGKAGLSRWLMHALRGPRSEECTDAQSVFVLLDYEARRNKQENKRDLHGVVSSDSIVRLRSNIKDVDLSQFLVHKDRSDAVRLLSGKVGSPEYRISDLLDKIEKIQTRPEWPLRDTVGTAKHLCGAATDFGLRCLERIKVKSKVSLCFATCCHHRCDWKQLVGKDILMAIGACRSGEEFHVLCSHAGWATTAGLSDEKRRIGRLIKNLIDLSRVHWIASTFAGIQTLQFRPYIASAVTPENFAIVLTSG